MISFFQLIIGNSFKTLPNGKGVFVNLGFFKNTYSLIPNPNLETILKNKVFWVNIIPIVWAIGGIFIIGFYSITNFYVVCPFILLSQILTLFIRQAIVSKDISKLQKIKTKYESFYFYDNFTNKVEVGKNKIPPNYEIAKYLDASENEDKILLLIYKNSSPIILRCALGGWIIWQSEIMPKFNDMLANMEWLNNRILVSSEANSSFLLDANTGLIVEEK